MAAAAFNVTVSKQALTVQAITGIECQHFAMQMAGLPRGRSRKVRSIRISPILNSVPAGGNLANQCKYEIVAHRSIHTCPSNDQPFGKIEPSCG